MRHPHLIRTTIAAGALVAVLAGCSDEDEQTLSGIVTPRDELGLPAFDLADVVSGGVPRDGIPALTDPRMVPASSSEAGYLADQDRVVGLMMNGEPRAYPQNILWWHEVINDKVGGVPVIVTHCPLTGTSVVYDASFGGQRHTFGVSGFLYNNNLICYDRQVEGDPGRWVPQMYGAIVTGPGVGNGWPTLPAVETTWQHWRTLHPDTKVVSGQTGHSRNYELYPYGGYYTDGRLLFPLTKPLDSRFHLKALTYGLGLNGSFKAYPFQVLGDEPQVVNDTVGGIPVAIVYLPTWQTAWGFARTVGEEVLTFVFDWNGGDSRILDADGDAMWSVEGDPLEGTSIPLTPLDGGYIGFWFAWAAFHPGIDVYDEP